MKNLTQILPVVGNLYIYTGAGHKIWISSKSWFISRIPFKKWKLYDVYIQSTHISFFLFFLTFNILMIPLYRQAFL